MAQYDAPAAPSVLPDAAPQPYLQDVAPPGAFGAQIGAALDQGGQIAAKAADAIQGLNNETAASNASIGFFKAKSDLDSKFYSLKGQAAVDAAPSYRDNIEALRDNTLASATNPMMRAQLAQDVQRQVAYAFSDMGRHVAQQSLQSSLESSSAKADTLASAAIGVRNDPRQLASLNASGQAEIAKVGELNGWSFDTTQQHIQQYNGDFYSKVIGTLAAENPLRAKALYDSVAPTMDAASQARMAEYLKPKVQTYQANQIANLVSSSSAPAPGLAPAYVPADQRQALLEEAVQGTKVTPEVLGALVQHESGWNINARGSAGEIGLGQVKPSTAQSPGFNLPGIDPNSLTDVKQNLKFSAQYLQARGDAQGVTDYTDQNQAKMALAAYNSGSGKEQYAKDVAATAFQAPDLAAWQAKARSMAGDDPELQERAVAAVAERYHQWSSATAVQRASLSKQIDNISAALGDGRTDVAIPEQQIRSLYPPEQADDIVSKLQAQQQAGLIVSQVKYAAPDELVSLRARLAEGVGSPGAIGKKGSQGGAGSDDATNLDNYALNSAKLRAFDAAMAARQQQMADPASYVAGSPAVAQAAKAFQAAPNDANAAQAYFQASLAEQARLGVPPEKRAVLSDALAKQDAASIHALDPKDANTTQKLNDMAKQYGDYWPAAFYDMSTRGGLNPQYQALAVMDPNSPQQTDAQRVLQFIANSKDGADGLIKYATAPVAKKIDDLLDGDKNTDQNATMQNFSDSGSLQSGGMQLVNNTRSMVKNMAYYYAGSKMAASPDEAVSMAVKWIDDKYDFANGARVPKNMGGQFDAVTSDLVNGLKADDLAAGYIKRPGLSENDAKAYLQAAQRGRWQTNARDDGAVLMGNFGGVYLPVRSKDGQVISVQFKDVPAMMAQKNLQTPVPSAEQDPAG